jgi:hypothetical protein
MDARIVPAATALRAAVLLLCSCLAAGCTYVRINPGSTDTVEHSGGAEEGKVLANQVCARAKAVRAEIISTVEKEAGKGRYVTTFRCIY